MCIILIGKVTKEQVKEAKLENSHGFSVFTKEHGLVKAPNANLVNKIVNEGLFGIWHFRIASSGTIDNNNIHPFRVNHGKYLLYHNGVLGDGLGNLSDTRALAQTLYDLPLCSIRQVLKATSGISNKFALVCATDVTKFELFGDWSVDAGVIMSHKLYGMFSNKNTNWRNMQIWENN